MIRHYKVDHLTAPDAAYKHGLGYVRERKEANIQLASDALRSTEANFAVGIIAVEAGEMLQRFKTGIQDSKDESAILWLPGQRVIQGHEAVDDMDAENIMADMSELRRHHGNDGLIVFEGFYFVPGLGTGSPRVSEAIREKITANRDKSYKQRKEPAILTIGKGRILPAHAYPRQGDLGIGELLTKLSLEADGKTLPILPASAEKPEIANRKSSRQEAAVFVAPEIVVPMGMTRLP